MLNVGCDGALKRNYIQSKERRARDDLFIKRDGD